MNRPILVTGSHRSGKSIITNGIAQSGKYNIIHEPLNINQRIGRNGLKLKHYYTYIYEGNSDRFKKEFDSTLCYDYRLVQEIKSVNSFYDMGRICKDILLSLKHKMNKKAPLIDDPFSVFSAEWFYHQYDAKIIVLIRQPASFVSSLKTLNYHFPFGDLLEQKELMIQKLNPFKNEIKEFCETNKTIVEQGELLWRIIYSSVLNYRIKYKDDWLFIKFEDLIDNPYKTFNKTYRYIDNQSCKLDFKKIEKNVLFKKYDKENINSLDHDESIYQYPYQVQKNKYVNNLTKKEIQHINKFNKSIYNQL